MLKRIEVFWSGRNEKGAQAARAAALGRSAGAAGATCVQRHSRRSPALLRDQTQIMTAVDFSAQFDLFITLPSLLRTGA